MKKPSFLYPGLLALAVASTSGIALAGEPDMPDGDAMFVTTGMMDDPPMPPMSPMMGMHMHGDSPFEIVKLAEELDLSADQRRKIGAIMDAEMPRMRDLMFRMADARKALHEYMKGDKKDDATLKKLTDEHGRIMAEMMYLHIKSHDDMRAVLTPDQVKKLEEGRHGGFMHHMFRHHLTDK